MSDIIPEDTIVDAISVGTPDSTSSTMTPIEQQRADWNSRFEGQDSHGNQDEDAPPVARTPAAKSDAVDQATQAAKDIAEAFADIKWTDGKDYKVPAVFKDVLTKAESLDRDYTQKSQKFASERAEVENALKAEFERVQLHREHIEELTEARQLSDRLAQYKDIDFAAWAAQDPGAAGKHQVIRNELGDRLKVLRESVTDKVTKQETDARRSQQVSILKAQDEIKKAIPDWGPEVAKKLTEFSVKTLNIPMEILNDLNQFPWAVRALHMAMGQHSALTAAQPQNLPKPTPEPVPKVGGSAPAAKNSDQLSMSDWLKWRNGQVAKARQSGSRIH